MLQELRRGAGNLLAKALLALLVLAFVIWGVAPGLRDIGSGSVARVGKTDITADDFQQAYQDEVNAASQQYGRRLTPDQARLLGIEGRALSRLLSAGALDAHARDLDLGLADKTIADELRNEPAFKDQTTGKFERALLDGYMRQNGLSEARFIAIQRREALREQLSTSLIADLNPPQTMIDILHRFREETRKIDFAVIDPAKAVPVAAPDEAKLKEYYEQNKARFMTPEQRRLAVLLLLPADVKKKITISDDDIKATYELEKEKFNIAEKRRVTQLSFPDKAAADKAYAELAKAKAFAEAVTKLGFKVTDTDLGVVTKAAMIDAKIAEAAFALKKDELSQPVQGTFGLVLLRVSEIEPGRQRTLDDVKGEIADRLAGERAQRDIQAAHDEVENARASGKTLKEIAEKFQLAFREVAATDRTAKGRDGKPALDHPDAGRIVQAAFGGAAGVEAEAIELTDGGYAWFDVLATTPEAQRPLDDAKADVTAAWTVAERTKELNAFAVQIVTRVAKGEAFAVIAKELGLKIETTAPVTRSTSPQGLTANAVQQAFALPIGGASSTATADGSSRIVFRVAETIPAPAPTKQQVDRLKAELTRQLQGDVLAGYIGGLQARYGVSINEAAVRQLLGQDRTR